MTSLKEFASEVLFACATEGFGTMYQDHDEAKKMAESYIKELEQHMKDIVESRDNASTSFRPIAVTVMKATVDEVLRFLRGES